MATSIVDGKRQKTGGRKKGTPNKTTALLKDAILKAAQKAGGDGDEGLAKYLQSQAIANPTAFLSLLGKVLPYQINGGEDPDGKPTAINVNIVDPRG
jgi:hypothetical protein